MLVRQKRKQGKIYEVRTFPNTKAIVTNWEKQDSFHGNNEIHEQCFNSRRSKLMEWTDVKQQQVAEWISKITLLLLKRFWAPWGKEYLIQGNSFFFSFFCLPTESCYGGKMTSSYSWMAVVSHWVFTLEILVFSKSNFLKTLQKMSHRGRNKRNETGLK